MNIAELFISLGVKGDTKALDAVLKKLQDAKVEAEGLVTELGKIDKATSKSSPAGSNLILGKASSARASVSNGRAEWEKDIKREETLKKKRFQLEEKREKDAIKEEKEKDKEQKKREKDAIKEEKEKDKEQKKREKDAIKEEKEKDKEQKKREKDRERATKKFFGQIESGFSTAAKVFLGGLGATALGGYVTNLASKNVGAANLTSQYGLDAAEVNRYANAFKVGSGGAITKQGGIAVIGSIAQALANNALTNELLPQFTALGLSPENARDPIELFKALRQTSLNNPYKEKYFTSLTSGLGIPPEIAQVLNSKQTSDKEFNRLYNLSPLSEGEIDAGKRVSSKLSEFEVALEKLQGTLIDKFQEPLIRIVDYLQKKLTPENISKTAVVGGGILAGLGASKYIKFAGGVANAGKGLGAAAAGFAFYNFLSDLAERNEKLINYKKRPKEAKAGKYVADFGENNYNYSSYDPNRTYSPRELEAAKQMTSLNSQATNVTNNVNVNVKADSIDQNSVPFLAGSISERVGELRFESDFLRRTTPK